MRALTFWSMTSLRKTSSSSGSSYSSGSSGSASMKSAGGRRTRACRQDLRPRPVSSRRSCRYGQIASSFSKLFPGCSFASTRQRRPQRARKLVRALPTLQRMSLARGSWVRAGSTRARVAWRASLGPNVSSNKTKVPIPAKPNCLSVCGVAIQRTKFATDRFRCWSAQRRNFSRRKSCPVPQSALGSFPFVQ